MRKKIFLFLTCEFMRDDDGDDGVLWFVDELIVVAQVVSLCAHVYGE